MTVDRSDLVTDHGKLVDSVLRQVTRSFPRHVDRDDLRQAGFVGLIQASRSYQPSRGVSFSHYARFRIRGAMLDATRSRDWVPRDVRARQRAQTEAYAALRQRLGRTPTECEVIAELGVSDLEEGGREISSLDCLDAEVPADDRWTPDVAVEDSALREDLAAALTHLPERHRSVVVGYYVDERSLGDLADEFGLTSARICQIKREALELLAEALCTARGWAEGDQESVESATRAAYMARLASHGLLRSKPTGLEQTDSN